MVSQYSAIETLYSLLFVFSEEEGKVQASSYLVALFNIIYTILLCILLFNNRKGSCSGYL